MNFHDTIKLVLPYWRDIYGPSYLISFYLIPTFIVFAGYIFAWRLTRGTLAIRLISLLAGTLGGFPLAYFIFDLSRFWQELGQEYDFFSRVSIFTWLISLAAGAVVIFVSFAANRILQKVLPKIGRL